MISSKEYKAQLSSTALNVLENFENKGEDYYYLLGQMIEGKQTSSVASIINAAQVFSRIDLRGKVGSLRGFLKPVSAKAGGEIKPLFDKGNTFKFTSHVAILDNPGMSTMAYTFASSDNIAFGKMSVGGDIAPVEQKLKDIYAEEKKYSIKLPFGKSKSDSDVVKTSVVNANTSNAYQNLFKEVYDIILAQLDNNEYISTKIEKVTASLFATLLVSRAMNFNNVVDEIKIDESLNLDFCGHLNACDKAGIGQISQVLVQGTKQALVMIEKLGLTKEDIANKAERLGTPLLNKPANVQEALFGLKDVNLSLDQFAVLEGEPVEEVAKALGVDMDTYNAIRLELEQKQQEYNDLQQQTNEVIKDNQDNKRLIETYESMLQAAYEDAQKYQKQVEELQEQINKKNQELNVANKKVSEMFASIAVQSVNAGELGRGKINLDTFTKQIMKSTLKTVNTLLENSKVTKDDSYTSFVAGFSAQLNGQTSKDKNSTFALGFEKAENLKEYIKTIINEKVFEGTEEIVCEKDQNISTVRAELKKKFYTYAFDSCDKASYDKKIKNNIKEMYQCYSSKVKKELFVDEK